MSVFVDTSAFLAIIDRNDQNHQIAKQLWIQLLHNKAALLCTNYVLLETLALIQHRFGLPVAKTFQEDIVPIIHIHWVDEALHQAGIAAVLTANRRRLSLVDCISFETARRLGVNTIFAFDQHFVEQGFTCLS